MKVLTSFPGRAGDILWALPSVRAVSEAFGTPVDFMVGGEFASLVPLLQHQPYIATAWANPSWTLTPPDEWRPPFAAYPYDRIFHLGYRGWPTQPLPKTTEVTLQALWHLADGPTPPIDLDRPWIMPTFTMPPAPRRIVAGFTEEWFELKYGLHWLLQNHFVFDHPQPRSTEYVQTSTGARWQAARIGPSSWEATAAWMATASVVVACCSAPHVLACAVGAPVVLVEPSPARHDPIFYPYGTTGRVQLVLGNDGRPTFDARHVCNAIETVLQRRQAEAETEAAS